MTITKTEVKTFYSIKITLADFKIAYGNYIASMTTHRHPKAFNFIPEKVTEEEFEYIFKNLGITTGNGDTYKYLANHFGFDGWHNCGYHRDSDNTHMMVCYNDGATL